MLLERVDQRLEGEPSAADESTALLQLDAEIRGFLERGAATGVFLEETRQRTACQVLLDYWSSSLERAGLQAPRARLVAFDVERLPDLEDKPCPYVGLEAFRESRYFFGREADTRRLVEKIRQTPLVVVLGASGSGKSSLVLGGAIPALARLETGFRIAEAVVPGDAALERFVQALRDLTATPPGELDPETAIAALGSRPAIVVIDQFEELFTLTPESERSRLATSLSALLAADSGHRVVLTMREEFRSRMVELRALEPFLDDAYYSMRPMGFEELRAAIVNPAAMVNLHYQAGIVEELVTSVLGQPAALPLLQFTLRALWENRDRNRITWEVYRRVGGPLEALPASAEAFYGGLARQTQDEIRRILVELVRVDELLEAYRQPVPRRRLVEAGRANTVEVLELLTENDYVRLTEGARAGDAVVEVKHEALIRNWPRYVEWIDEKRLEQRQRLVLTQAAKRWHDYGQQAEDLMTGWRLEEAKRRPDLSSEEREFVEASVAAIEEAERQRQAAREREARQQRDLEEVQRRAEESRRIARIRSRASLGLAVLLALSVGATVLAVRATRRANAESLKNEARREAIEAIGELASRPVESLRLAARANAKLIASGIVPDPDVQQSLRQVLAQTGGVPLAGTGEHEARRLAFSPVGTRLAAADGQGAVRIWEIGTPGDPPQLLEAHGEQSVEVLAWSSDGLRLASAGVDGTVVLWELPRGREHSSTRLAAPRQGDFFSATPLAFDPAGDYLVGGDSAAGLRIWSVAAPEGPPIVQRPAGVGRIEAVAFSTDGEWLATADSSGRIDLWSTEALLKPEAEPLELRAGGASIRSLGFSSGGNWLGAGTVDGLTLLWKHARRSPPWQRVEMSEAGGGMLAFAGESRWLATADIQSALRLWDLAAPAPATADLPGDMELQLASLATSPDGRWLAVGSLDGVVRLWRLGPGGASGPKTLRGQGEAVIELAWSADGRWLASSSPDGQLRVWDAASPAAEPAELRHHERQVNALAFSADGRLLALAGTDRTVSLWSVAGDPPWPAPQVLAGHRAAVVGLEISGDDRWLVTRGAEGTVLLWGLATSTAGAGRPTDLTPRAGASSLRFSPDSKSLAIGERDGPVRLLQLGEDRQPEIRDRLEGHRGEVLALAFSPDGTLLASGSEDGTARLWRLGAERESPTILKSEFARRVSQVAFSEDGAWLATGGGDDTARLWDARAPDPAATEQRLAGHGSSVTALAFQPGGSMLATAGQGGALWLWDAAAPDPAAAGRELASPDGWRHLAFSRRGDLLAVATSNEVRLWNLQLESADSLKLPGAIASGSALAFSPHGEWLATGGGPDGTGQLYRLDTEALIALACRTAGEALLADLDAPQLGTTARLASCRRRQEAGGPDREEPD